MSTYADELAALERKQADERANLDARRSILENLPTFMHEYELFVHVSKLYDQTASVHVKYQRYSSLKKHDDPTIKTLKAIAGAFEFVPPAVFRDGSVGIRSLENAREALSKAEARNPDTSAQLDPIAPFWITVDPAAHAQEMTFELLVHVPNVAGVVEVNVTFPLYGDVARKIGHVVVRRDAHPNSPYYQHARIVENKFIVNPALGVVGDARGDLIRYASGSAETPGRHVLYYSAANGETPRLTLAEFVATLEGVTI